MRRLPVVVRGLGYRRGSTAAMLTIAAVGCAAAAVLAGDLSSLG